MRRAFNLYRRLVSSRQDLSLHGRCALDCQRAKLSADCQGHADAAIDTAVVHVLAPPTTTAPAKSGLLALNPAQTELWVANPDSDSVSALLVTSNSLVKLAEIPVGRQPRTLAFSPDGARVYVGCQGTNELSV